MVVDIYYLTNKKMLPTLSRNQSLSYLVLSLLGLYWLLAAKPALVTEASDKKQISPLRMILAYILLSICAFFIILLFSKFAKSKGDGSQSGGLMSGLGLGSPPQAAPAGPPPGFDDMVSPSSGVSPGPGPGAGVYA